MNHIVFSLQYHFTSAKNIQWDNIQNTSLTSDNIPNSLIYWMPSTSLYTGITNFWGHLFFGPPCNPVLLTAYYTLSQINYVTKAYCTSVHNSDKCWPIYKNSVSVVFSVIFATKSTSHFPLYLKDVTALIREIQKVHSFSTHCIVYSSSSKTEKSWVK